MAIGRPSPSLRPFVEQYVGYRERGRAPRLHRGLPSGHVGLIISLDAPVELAAMPDRRQATGSFQALVAGLHVAPALIADDGHAHGIQVELSPLGIRALLGLPAGELAMSVVHLDDLLGRRARELVERLACASDWPSRFGVLDEVLTCAAREAPAPPEELDWAWRQLVRSGGTVEVGRLAGEIGWSRRHLADRFRRELGLTPKVAGRVLRFQRSLQLVRRPDRPGLAEVAAASGYYDQAHLTREWVELAGCSPTVWMSEEL
jgi:AraC-like DNA-binding protein